MKPRFEDLKTMCVHEYPFGGCIVLKRQNKDNRNCSESTCPIWRKWREDEKPEDFKDKGFTAPFTDMSAEDCEKARAKLKEITKEVVGNLNHGLLPMTSPCHDCKHMGKDVDALPCRSCHAEDGNPHKEVESKPESTFTVAQVEAWLESECKKDEHKKTSLCFLNLCLSYLQSHLRSPTIGLAAYTKGQGK